MKTKAREQMKYTIEGFSQEYAIKLQKEIVQGGKVKRLRIDCADLLILRWFVDFYPRMVKTEIGGVQYAWVNYKELLDDMPILDMGRHSLAARLQKLVEFKILKHITLKTNGTFSYYGFGENYINLLSNEKKGGIQQTVQGIQQTVQPLYSKVDTPYTANCTPNNSSTIYNPSTINDSGTHARFQPPTVDEVRAYCKERNNKIDPEKFVDFYTANGWVQSRGKPIKDWKAAVRTWERNGYDSGGHTQDPYQLNEDESPIFGGTYL